MANICYSNPPTQYENGLWNISSKQKTSPTNWKSLIFFSNQCNKNLIRDYYVSGTMLDLVNTKLNKTFFLALKVFSESLRTVFLRNHPFGFYPTLVYPSPLLSVCAFILKINLSGSTGAFNWWIPRLEGTSILFTADSMTWSHLVPPERFSEL